jgi:hypothetical protein
MTWTASPTTGLLMYRIYRGGTGVSNRIAAVSPTITTFTDDASPLTATYYVTAVDATYNESAPLGPFNWTAP